MFWLGGLSCCCGLETWACVSGTDLDCVVLNLVTFGNLDVFGSSFGFVGLDVGVYIV